MNSTRGLKDVLWALALAGLVAGSFRLWFGLGATTNLSDAVPWGLWKILNMVAGVALSTSGFTVGFLVYVLKLERFRPLVKPAVLVAFLGYGCSCLALLFDIGLPHRFWHPFVMWGEHSFLFEVFWCVSLYFTVTALELSPTILARLRATRAAAFLHRTAFGVVILGISLSSLHHSSLGSLFLVTPQRLHPLWYTPLLPLLFIISAMGGGLMFLVLVRMLYARWYDPEPVYGPRSASRQLIVLSSVRARSEGGTRGRDFPMLVQLATIAGGFLLVYLGLELYNLVATGSWRALLRGSWESWLFAFELLLSAVAPVLLVAVARARHSPAALALAAFSASSGLLLNRAAVGIFGYLRDAGELYFPSLAEWALSLGVVAAAVLAFLFLAENTAIFDDRWRERPAAQSAFRAAFDSLSRVSRTALSSSLQRVSVIATLVIPLAFAGMYPPFAAPREAEIRPANGLDVLRSKLRIDGDDAGLSADFPHAEHQARLGGEAGCATCHHLALPGDQTTPCSRCHRQMVLPTEIFDHVRHQVRVAVAERLTGVQPANHSCAICHTGSEAKSAENAKPCLECHSTDAGWREADPTADLSSAVSYLEAMHGTCLECHEGERLLRMKPTLSDCGTCHQRPSTALAPRAGGRLAYRAPAEVR